VSVEQLEQTLLSLSFQERRHFMEWLYEHEGELLGAADDIDAGVKEEVLRRRDDALAHPEKLESWDDAFPRMKQSFDELRGKNPYTR